MIVSLHLFIIGSTMSGHWAYWRKGARQIRGVCHKLNFDIDPILGTLINKVQSTILFNDIGVPTRESIAKKYIKWSEVPETNKGELFTHLNVN